MADNKTKQSKEIKEMSEFLLSPRTPRSQTVVVAINGRKNSKYVIKWALDNFVTNESPVFKLLHVCVTITSVPTPMGVMPISQVREDIADTYKQEVEWKKTELLVLYKRMFLERKVQVDVLRIEGDDIANSIANEVAKGRVNKLVIGASSRGGLFTRKVNGENFSSKITEIIPSFCTVYAVSKAKLSSVRESTSDMSVSIKDDNSDTSWSGKLSPVHKSPSETSGSIRDVNSVTISSKVSSLQTADSAVSENSPRRDQGSATSYSHSSSDSPAMQTFEALTNIKQTLPNSRTEVTVFNPTRNKYLDIIEEEADLPSFSIYSDTISSSSLASSFQRQMAQNQSWISDTSEVGLEPSESEIFMSSELEKLRIELLRTRGMYAVAQSETLEASRKLNEMTKSRLGEQGTPKEGSFSEMSKSSPLQEQGMPKGVRFIDEKSEELVQPEKEKHQDAKRKANHVSEYAAQREASERKEAETKSADDAKEKENLQVAHFGPMQQYKKFMWEEIVTATSSFSEKLIIGKGASGTVYKCNLHHTTAAVKVLHSREVHSIKQFQQEFEILSRIRHPYLVLLIGACPEQGCLVYEYMENGSLEDRLLRKNNKTHPIPWFDRFRIAWEIASGLVFLHNSKPKRIIHRDLKPANILLDHNLGSKIGDVGLSKMVQSADAFAMSMYNQTTLVGTLSYIDPEYQRTGLNSPKSDVYAFGLVVLQLLTAKSTNALTHMVETAVDEDTLVKVLDRRAGQWPLAEAKELAILGLRCAELRRKDRPDLKDHVLPKLEILRAAADRARDAAHTNLLAPPNHFLCPIRKGVMKDPCVAADGYTYDRKSIEKWLRTKDTSPMTNVILPTKNLIPNFTLLSAISQWKSEQA